MDECMSVCVSGVCACVCKYFANCPNGCIIIITENNKEYQPHFLTNWMLSLRTPGKTCQHSSATEENMTERNQIKKETSTENNLSGRDFKLLRET